MICESNPEAASGGRRLRETQVLLAIIGHDPDLISECRRNNRAAAQLEAMLALACFAGLNFGEIEALHVADFDRTLGSIHVRRLRNRAGQIEVLDRNRRAVSLRENVAAMLSEWIGRHVPEDEKLLFPMVRSAKALAAAEARRSRRRAAD